MTGPGSMPKVAEAHLRMLFRKLKVSRRDELASPPAQPRDEPAASGAESDDEVIRRLEVALSERDRQIQSYDAAVQRMIDRQFPLFDEQVEILIKVGRHSNEDMVVERHWTTPKPYLVYRVVRPIAADHLASQDVTDLLAVACEVVGVDVGVAVQLVTDRMNRPIAIIFFQPGLEGHTEWILRYRTPGLWDPLRDRGEDALFWAAGTLDGRYADGLSNLRVIFEFPPGTTSAEVIERQGIGQLTEDFGASAPTFLFTDGSRTGGHYHWSLRMSLKE